MRGFNRPRSASSPRFFQTNQARVRWYEPTRTIERGQVRFPVDMKPFAASLPGQVRCPPDQFLPNPSVPLPRDDGRLQEEGMLRSVPCQVDETDEGRPFVGTDVAETLLEHRQKVEGLVLGPGFGVESVELPIRHAGRCGVANGDGVGHGSRRARSLLRFLFATTPPVLSRDASGLGRHSRLNVQCERAVAQGHRHPSWKSPATTAVRRAGQAVCALFGVRGKGEGAEVYVDPGMRGLEPRSLSLGPEFQSNSP